LGAKIDVGIKDGLAVYPDRQVVFDMIRAGVRGQDIGQRMLPISNRLSSEGLEEVLKLAADDFCFRLTGEELKEVVENVQFVNTEKEAYAVLNTNTIQWLIMLGCVWGFRAGHRPELEEKYKRLLAEVGACKASLRRNIDRFDQATQ